MKVTREVVTDLWPVYAAGEAHADTRVLVEDFLKGDPEFARLVQERAGVERLLAQPAPKGTLDREALALARTKSLLHGRNWLVLLQLQAAIIFTCLAFGRIVSDTSWDVSPRNFIITLSIAAILWASYLASMLWIRRSVYRKALKDTGIGE